MRKLIWRLVVTQSMYYAIPSRLALAHNVRRFVEDNTTCCRNAASQDINDWLT
jgi:hypothetical protein